MKLLVVLLALVATVSPAPQDIVFGSLTPDGTIPSSKDSPVDVWKHFKVSSHKNGRPVEGETLSGPNPYDHFELVPSNILNRHRRGLLEWIKKSIARYNRNTKAQPIIPRENSANKISSGDDDQTVEFSKSKPQSAPLPVTAGESIGDISYTGDTDVNYLGPVQPRDNPDAEVFDINLVREDANRFFARRPQPDRAQSMMSANKISSGDDDQTVEFSKSKPQSAPLPVTAGESRGDISYTGDTDVNYLGAVQPRDNPDAEVFNINLVREDANRFFARRPQPDRAQPMMSQPIRSQPMRSQPIRSQPMMFQPIRAQPMMYQPIRSHRTVQG